MQSYSYLLPFVLFHAAEQSPNKTAVIIDRDYYSYQRIYKDSLAFSENIKIKKYKTTSRILILSGNSYLTIIAFWGSLLAEMVPCIVDADISNDVLDNIIKNINPCFIVTNGSLLADHLHYTQNHHLTFHANENDMAMMMHTSGSTGYPKGVMLSHRNVLAAIDSIAHYLGLMEQDVILSVLPMHFDYGLYQMLLTFKAGATLILEKNALFPNIITHKIKNFKVTALPCVPLLIQLLYTVSKKQFYDFSSVRLVTNTGENLSIQHIQKLKEIFSQALIFSMYGLTECKRCSYVPPHRLDEKSESIGIPMLNLNMWIQDSAGNRVGPNVEGELVISGPTVMMGYWKDCIETAKKITIGPDGKKILLSGDRACMDSDGYFYFRGREDFIVKLNGAKLNCYDHAKKLTLIKEVNRAYLFLNAIDDLNQLIVCIELNSMMDESNELKLEIMSQFLPTQKPHYLYFTHQFPSFGNGKLDKRLLEKSALNYLVCRVIDEH